MPFIVAPGHRVQQNRIVYCEGQSIPFGDRDLLESGALIEVCSPLSDPGYPDPEPEPVQIGTVKVDVNVAELAELIALDGIGEATAARIIDNRPYDSLEQVKAGTGLKGALWAKVEAQITV